jgi:Fe-S cluster assembly protein SufD
VGNLSNFPSSLREKLTKYLAQSESKQEVFPTLNTSGITDCAIVWAKKNTQFTTPIHLLHLTISNNYASFAQPRILVVAERNSHLNLVEYYGAVAKGCSDAARQQYYFNNVVTEIYGEENAHINHSRIQRESGDGFHIAKTFIYQFRDSHYTLNEISLGAKFYRHNLSIQQEGEQTETNLNGLTMAQGKQVADTHTVVNLTKPHGTVNQLHKYILDDAARGVFNGKIYVPKQAQLTNATQLNRNLLLSPKARINTKPELQITADNVKCAHGATVSQLEADEIFYLQSRGLNEYDARHLLLDAFAAEILDKLPLNSLQQRLTQCVACRTFD